MGPYPVLQYGMWAGPYTGHQTQDLTLGRYVVLSLKPQSLAPLPRNFLQILLLVYVQKPGTYRL